MKKISIKNFLIVTFLLIFQNLFLSIIASANPSHGIAMYGMPKLPQDFVSLPYTNTNAKPGGVLVFGERGGFDSMNPYIRKGRAPWGV